MMGRALLLRARILLRRRRRRGEELVDGSRVDSAGGRAAVADAHATVAQVI